jgi:signal transduction histidine kinase
MPTGGTLRLASYALQNDVFIRVQDSGVGMDRHRLARVFEPFYSTKRGNETTALGRGLGLAVAHGIIKVLRGEITLFSRVGEGTSLEIRLPLEPEGPAASESLA